MESCVKISVRDNRSEVDVHFGIMGLCCGQHTKCPLVFLFGRSRFLQVPCGLFLPRSCLARTSFGGGFVANGC